MAAHCNSQCLLAGSPATAHRSIGASHQSRLHKPSRPALYAQATSTGRDTSKSKSGRKDDELPEFEDSSNDVGELLPKREPGSFPNMAVRDRYSRHPYPFLALLSPTSHQMRFSFAQTADMSTMLWLKSILTCAFCRGFTRSLSSLVGRLSEDHFVGADEKFAVKTAGIKEFDPLRDGPLRYLGYSNECG